MRFLQTFSRLFLGTDILLEHGTSKLMMQASQPRTAGDAHAMGNWCRLLLRKRPSFPLPGQRDVPLQWASAAFKIRGLLTPIICHTGEILIRFYSHASNTRRVTLNPKPCPCLYPLR